MTQGDWTHCFWSASLRAAVLIAAVVGAGTTAAQPQAPVSSWPGDGGAADAVGTNDGALAGGASTAPGKVGDAFSFDGVARWSTSNFQINRWY